MTDNTSRFPAARDAPMRAFAYAIQSDALCITERSARAGATAGWPGRVCRCFYIETSWNAPYIPA